MIFQYWSDVWPFGCSSTAFLDSWEFAVGELPGIGACHQQINVDHTESITEVKWSLLSQMLLNQLPAFLKGIVRVLSNRF
jgi:hypothetical protein